MRKRVLFIVAAMVAVVSGIVGMSAFEAHVINVTAKIENALAVTPDEITFGTVFPEEYLVEQINIGMSQSFIDEGRVDDVNYVIKQKPKPRPEIAEFPGAVPGHVYCLENSPADPGDPADPYYEFCYPSLCEFLSKHDADPEDGNDGPDINAFHAANAVTSGRLAKSEDDFSDIWDIDLLAPCFMGQCAQDGVVPPDYQLDPRLESEEFGCDLWVEVNGISRFDGDSDRTNIVPPNSTSLFYLDDDLILLAAANQLVLVLEEDITPGEEQAILDLLASYGASVIGQIPVLNIWQIGAPSQEITEELLGLLPGYAGVEDAYLNMMGQESLAATPADYSCNTGNGSAVPLDDCDYWIEAVNLPAAWDVTTGSSDYPIGIVDTGIDEDCGHFVDKDINILNASWLDTYFGDINGHGTAVASMAASRGDDGVLATGVAWESPLIITDVYGFFSLDISAAIVLAISNGARVVNISSGANTFDIPEEDSSELVFLRYQQNFRRAQNSAVAYAAYANALLVFAAHNDGDGYGRGFSVKNDDQYLPAGSSQFYIDAWESNTLIVAATGPDPESDPFGAGTIQVATYFTREGSVVDLAAPGLSVSVAQAISSDITKANSGTSFSAPMVAGIAALVWSEFPGKTASEIKTILKNSATPIDYNVGAGLVNAGAAVRNGCGNGVLEDGEECDDGNNKDGDGCSADCVIEGDRIVFPTYPTTLDCLTDIGDKAAIGGGYEIVLTGANSEEMRFGLLRDSVVVEEAVSAFINTPVLRQDGDIFVEYEGIVFTDGPEPDMACFYSGLETGEVTISVDSTTAARGGPYTFSLASPADTEISCFGHHFLYGYGDGDIVDSWGDSCESSDINAVDLTINIPSDADLMTYDFWLEFTVNGNYHIGGEFELDVIEAVY